MGRRAKGHDDLTPMESRLQFYFERFQTRPEFVTGLRDQIWQRASSSVAPDTADRVRSGFLQSRRIPWGLHSWKIGRSLIYVFTILILALVVIHHEPVWAAMQRLLGYAYLPQAGFVSIDGTRVLRGPTAQTMDGATLLVTQVTASVEKTRIWFRLDGAVAIDAIDPDDTGSIWLEVESKQKLFPGSWSWSVADDGHIEGYLEFGALSEETTSFLLVLSPDWQMTLFLNDLPAGGSFSSVVYPDVCIDRSGVDICILAMIADPEGTHLLISTKAQDDDLHSLSLASKSPATAGEGLMLIDDGGRIYSPRSDIGLPIPVEWSPGSGRTVTDMLHFDPLYEDAASLTLRIPAVNAEVDLNVDFEVEGEEGARLGDRSGVALSFEAVGQEIVFERAEIFQDAQGPWFILTSQPVSSIDDRQIIGFQLAQVSLEGAESLDHQLWGTGFEAASREIRLWWSLEGYEQELWDGPYHVIIDSAQVCLSGPFELAWQLPPG